MNFIEIYEKTIPSEHCDRLINLFEKYDYLHARGGTNNGVDEKYKKSTEISIDQDLIQNPEWNESLNIVFSSLQKNLKNYKIKYSEYENDNSIIGIDSLQYWEMDSIFNFQRFFPGEGHYTWHCESPGKNLSDRLLCWMVYLNDVEDGGETEFKFQNYKSKARQGKMVIWPPYWTHFHRGIPSFTEKKYILTGWFSFK
jgi:hypothetical protein